MPDDQPEFLTRTAAAALLSISPYTLDRWAAAGRIPVHRLPNGHPRYKRSEVLALPELDAAEQAPDNPAPPPRACRARP